MKKLMVFDRGGASNRPDPAFSWGGAYMDLDEIQLDKLVPFSTMTGDSATIDPGNQRIGIVAFQRMSKNKNRLSIRKVSVR